MTYATQKKKPGREPVMIVEIDGEYCQLQYGVAPCEAVLGVTGAQKCFNTRKSCQSLDNFDAETKTYRFASKQLPVSAPKNIPSVIACKLNPTKIAPGTGLGVRASVSVTFQDGPLSDHGLDKYVTERAYDSKTTGTFWGKWLARNPYYQNRPMRVKIGYLTRDADDRAVYDPANFQTRLYVIDKIDGPDANGKVTVTAKDVIKLIDDKRAQVPLPNKGVLLGPIDEVMTAITLDPPGIGDEDYPASGVGLIGSEIVTFTRTLDAVTIVRGQYNTEADSHDEGDAFQVCKVYDQVPIADLVYDLLVTQGSIDPAYCPLADWQAEANLWLPFHIMSTVITEPTGITTLVEELTKQALFYIFWDEIDQEIKFRAIRPPEVTEVTVLNEQDNIVMDSVSVTVDPGARLSQVWVFWGQINPAEQLDKASNYRKQVVQVDTDAESEEEYGELRVLKVYSRWLPADNVTPAQVLAARMLARYRDNPRTVKLKLDAKDNDLWTADAVRLTTRCIQSFTGEKEEAELQVVRVNEVDAGTLYEYELADAFFRGRYTYVMADSTPVFSLASDIQKRKGCFMCPDTLVFADGSPAYKLI